MEEGRRVGLFLFGLHRSSGKTCTQIPECDSRFPITRGQGHTNRMVPSATDIQQNFRVRHTALLKVTEEASCPETDGF